MIVAISDVHIGAPNSDIGAFVAFLNDVLMHDTGKRAYNE